MHADSTVTVRVSIDTKLVLPGCDGQTLAAAFQYIDGVLQDYAPGEPLVLRAQGIGTLLNHRAPNLAAARAWLLERAEDMLHTNERSERTWSVTSHSGTLPVVKSPEDAEAASHKKSGA